MQKPEIAKHEYQRELALLRYVQAFDAGDLDALAAILSEAMNDPELDRQIININAALHAEAGLQPTGEQAQLVRKLLLQHVPSGFHADEEMEQPLTVGSVAARLQADETQGRPLTPSDRQANQLLLTSQEPVPSPINSGLIAKLATRLQVSASDRYWELFRRAAVMLAIARKQGQVQIAAARRHPGKLPTAGNKQDGASSKGNPQ